VRTKRQGRLRPEYAGWYPNISVSSWLPANTLRRAVARQLLQRDPAWAPHWEPGPRLLDDTHFQFRRGIARSADERTRREDYVSPADEIDQAPLPT
jgi:hypothetical protein